MLPPSQATCVPRLYNDHQALALQYGCLGYSVHPDRSKLGVAQLQARVPPDTAELPYCQGVQVGSEPCCLLWVQAVSRRQQCSAQHFCRGLQM